MTQLVQASEAQHFDLVMRQAEVYAQSSIIPAAYRRKPADIVAAAMAGGAYGWDAMTSLRQFHVIEGMASLKPEAMLGLVRLAGHSVHVDIDGDAAVATGKRIDTGDTHEARFSMADAAAAGLAGKKNWKQYRDAMLTWRAVSALCRVLFPDVVLGAGYVPEEFGADVNEHGDPVGSAFSTDDPTDPRIDPEERSAIRNRLDELDGFQRDDIRDWWKAESIPSLDSGLVTGSQAELIFAKLYDLTDEIVEAEVVELPLSGGDDAE